MHMIHPVNETTCKEYIGRQVCVVLVDGTELVGTLGGVSGGKLHLNPCGCGPQEVAVNAAGGKKRSPAKGKGKKAKTAAFGYGYGYGYPGYYGGALALDLALIALLFAIPYFWI